MCIIFWLVVLTNVNLSAMTSFIQVVHTRAKKNAEAETACVCSGISL